MLKVTNLSKKYAQEIKKGILTTCEIKNTEIDKNEPLAVSNINFELKKGDILAILGENGSGKSTLLKMLAGLLEPSSGKIILNSQNVYGPSSKLVAGHDNIKLIHQSYNLQPNISVEENIKYHLRFFNQDYKLKRTEYLLDLCHLIDFKNKLPRQISGGEQQRTAIACAISTPTDILLLDEPFSNLDVFNSEILKTQMVNITKKEKIHTIFVTHDAEDALSVSSHLAVIKKGEIIQFDTPKNVYREPKNEYVAQITGFSMAFKQKELKDYFGIEIEKKLVFLRPEQLFLTDKIGATVISKSCSFRGGYYLISCVIESTKKKIFFYSQKEINENEKLILSCKF